MNFYVEDLCAKAFFDAAFGRRRQFSPGNELQQFSYGLELHLETKWFDVIPADLGLRAGLTRENTFFWGPVVNIQGISF